MKDRLHFEGRTRAALRFGFRSLLYARNHRTGQWTAAYDIGIWTPVNDTALDLALDDAYKAWLKEASDTEIKAAQMTRDGVPLDPMLIRLLRAANQSRDGTILAIGYGRHNPDGHMKSYPTATAKSLLNRGFLEFVKNAAWGDVYRITATGRTFIKSYDKA